MPSPLIFGADLVDQKDLIPSILKSKQFSNSAKAWSQQFEGGMFN